MPKKLYNKLIKSKLIQTKQNVQNTIHKKYQIFRND